MLASNLISASFILVLSSDQWATYLPTVIGCNRVIYSITGRMTLGLSRKLQFLSKYIFVCFFDALFVCFFVVLFVKESLDDLLFPFD